MPLYEYSCTTCGKVFESFSTMLKRSQPRTCPVCGTRTGQHVEIPEDGRVDTVGGYQMAAVMKDGRTVPGSFGKVARINKGKTPFKP